MSHASSYTVRAGRLFIAWAWLNVIGMVGLIATLFLSEYLLDRSLIPEKYRELFLFVMGLAFLLTMLTFAVGNALKEYRWRFGALVLALAWIFNFPVGTLFAAVASYYLVNGRKESPEDEDDDAAFRPPSDGRRIAPTLETKPFAPSEPGTRIPPTL